jgi:hypothetical protein
VTGRLSADDCLEGGWFEGMDSKETVKDLSPALSEETTLSDDLLLIGEEQAVQVSFDESNSRRLVHLVWFFTAAAAVYVVVYLASGNADLLFLRVRKAPWVERDIRQVCVGVLLAHLIVLQALHSEFAGWLGFCFAFFPVLATRFRFNPGETLALFASLFAVLTVRLVVENRFVLHSNVPFLQLSIFLLLVYLPLAGLSAWLSLRRERRFLLRYRSESQRHRDRLRMKQELEYAREIQLSMLPREAPSVSWLDIAALSIPATEVGGDYYDYFVLDDQRLVVVVGDVTGHGVASGLVLSGVRSSLNLLSDEMGRPEVILDRVNAMVKKTSTPRMLMTLAVAVLDYGERSLTVATAGHPPAIIARADGEIEELGQSAFPLGAMANAVDASGEQYGWGRLHDALAAQLETSSAKEIRDAVLHNVWDFKGTTEQVDDVTMIVIRCRP